MQCLITLPTPQDGARVDRRQQHHRGEGRGRERQPGARGAGQGDDPREREPDRGGGLRVQPQDGEQQHPGGRGEAGQTHRPLLRLHSQSRFRFVHYFITSSRVFLGVSLESAEVLPEMTVVYNEDGVIKRKLSSKTTFDLQPEIELLSKILPNHHQIHDTEKSNNETGSGDANAAETKDGRHNIDTSKSFLKTRNSLPSSAKINEKIVKLKSLMRKKEQK